MCTGKITKNRREGGNKNGNHEKKLNYIQYKTLFESLKKKSRKKLLFRSY